MGIHLNYKLRPSRILTLLFTALFTVTLAVLWMLPISAAGLVILTLVVLCWGGYHLLLNASLSLGFSCIAFRLENQNDIVLVLRNGSHLQGHVSADSLVTPYLIVLNIVLTEPRGRRSLLVLPDTMGADSFRTLRVALRWRDESDQVSV